MRFDFNAGDAEEEKKDNGLGSLNADPMSAFYEGVDADRQEEAPALQEQVQAQVVKQQQQQESA